MSDLHDSSPILTRAQVEAWCDQAMQQRAETMAKIDQIELHVGLALLALEAAQIEADDRARNQLIADAVAQLRRLTDADSLRGKPA